METVEIDENRLESNGVFVKWLSTPINPADLNQIQGVYPVKPPLPAIGGNEGCGLVEKVGSNVLDLKVGDLVVPAKSGLGTWCTYNIYKNYELFPIDKRLSVLDGATFQVNPCTAYRMLHDFIQLKEGETIVQNGGNSAVGRYVIQICRILKLKSVSVVRYRENIQELKKDLIDLGATAVYTEEEFAKEGRTLLGENIRLALNCVGGRSSLLLGRILANGGCMVSYGGMSKQPVQVSTGQLIFKDITLRGFWMSTWYTNSKNYFERVKMYENLAEWILSRKLKGAPYTALKLEDFEKALNSSVDSKQIFFLEGKE